MAKLILFSGMPGTGKSTLGYFLASHTGWAIITKDQIDCSLKKENLSSPIGSYKIILDLAELNLKRNVSIILEAAFSKQEFRTYAARLASQYQAEYYPIYCYCSDEAVWKERIEKRFETVDGWMPAQWGNVEKVKSYFEEWTTPHLSLDAIKSFSQNKNQLLNYIFPRVSSL